MSSPAGKPLSRLARKIRDQLLQTTTTPDIVCSDTAAVIEGSTDWDDVHALAGAKAAGAHYTAFGFHYVLCWNLEDMYICVYRERDGQLVGTIYKDGGFNEEESSKC